MNKSHQWAIQAYGGSVGDWYTISRDFFRLRISRRRQQDMRPISLFHATECLRKISEKTPYLQLRLMNVRTGETVPMEALGLAHITWKELVNATKQNNQSFNPVATNHVIPIQIP